MDKNKCNSCGGTKCSCKNKDFTKAVVEIDNPEQITLMRKVVIPSSMGDDTTVPPVVGKYRNVLLNYEANNKSYLYSSDGIPTLLNNGVTDYEAATNLPQINGNTLIGNKSAADLGLQSALTAGDGIEIENDTISISDIEQYAHFFDTVADMKAATNLINGSYARTLGFYSINDGGGAFYKIRTKESSDDVDERFLIAIGSNLVGELVHGQEINVLQMGVTDTNLASIINSLLENDYYVYIPRGNYNITETVRFTKQYQKLVSDGRLSCTASPAFKVGSYYGEFKFNNRCFTDLPDMTFIEIGSSDSNSFNNDIFINALFDFSIGIKFNPSNNKGCVYNNINFNYIRAKTHGILLTTGNGVNYVNENYFQGGYIRAENVGSVIKTIKGTNQIDKFNGNVFEHIGMEGNYEIGIDLDFAIYNQFENIRLSENDNTGEYYYIVTRNGSSNNNFSTKSATLLDKIKDENTVFYTNTNFYRIVSQNTANDTLGNAFYTLAGKKIIKRCDTQNALGKSVLAFPQDSTTHGNEPEFYVDDGTIVALGHTPDNSSLEYTLPEVFNLAGVSAFYLYVRDMGENNTMTIKQSNGVVIATKDQLGSGRLYQKFFKIEFVGQITGNRWKVTQLS